MNSHELIDHRHINEQEMTAVKKLISCIKPLLASAKSLLMQEYLTVAKLVEPVHFREAISKVAKSLTLVDTFESQLLKTTITVPEPKAPESKPLRDQIAKRLEQERKRKTKQVNQMKQVKSPPTSREEMNLKSNLKNGSIKMYQTIKGRSSSASSQKDSRL